MQNGVKNRESKENYLKAILILGGKLSEVRSVDVAKKLGVSKPSVSIAVKKLCSERLVEFGETHNLVLTKEGLEYATSIIERHMVLERFLTDVLEVDVETAHDDSCRLEHVVSAEVLNKLKESLPKSPVSTSK